jgi:hypothetical protein
MIVNDPKIITWISPNDGSRGKLQPNTNEVEHQTFGSEGGDLQVGLYGVGFHWYITLDGRIFQLWDTDSGANFRAMGREYESPAGGPLTEQQLGAGGYLTALEIRLGLLTDSYVDPDTTARASIWVNRDPDFHGAISHYNVQTDDGSVQHTDHITKAEWDRMRNGQPAPSAPYAMATGRPIMGPRTILVNGGVDSFMIDNSDTLWWHHVDTQGVGHPSVVVSHNADSRYPEIDITATPYGPFLTCAQKVNPGEPPAFMKIVIEGFRYVAKTL